MSWFGVTGTRSCFTGPPPSAARGFSSSSSCCNVPVRQTLDGARRRELFLHMQHGLRQRGAFAVMPAWSDMCFNAINQSMQSLLNELYASSGILVRAERSYVFLCTDV